MLSGNGWFNERPWLRSGLAIPLALGLLALLLVAVPDRPKQPLVGPGGWVASEGGLVPSSGDARELPRSLVGHPDSRFWTSWTPEGRREGTLTTVPFELPKRGFAVPIRGFPGAEGIRLEATCVATGERRVIARARTNSEWGIATFRPGKDWCLPDRMVTLGVEARTQRHELAIGPPFKISWQYQLKSSALQAAAYLYLAWMIMAGLFWVLYQGLGRIGSESLRAAATLAGFGLTSYAAFFVFWASPLAGALLAGLLGLLGMAGFVALAGQGRGPGGRFATPAWLVGSAWLWLLVALAIVFVFRLPEVNAGPWSPNARFDPASWSSDNQLPIRIGQMVATGHMDDTGWMGPWQVSDRPPLSYGWHAVFIRLFGTHLAWPDGDYQLFQHAWPVGILLNSLWAPVLLLMARRATGSGALAFGIVGAAFFSPFLLFNSGYIWPKLLSAAFGITAAWLLFGIGRGGDKRLPLRGDDTAFVLAALLSALALQSHGGAVFGVLAMLAITPWLRGWPSFRAMAISALVCIAVLGPWMLYQKLVDPPGNALLKFAFAGTFGFGEEDVGVLDTIRRAYASMTPAGWLQAKLAALKIILVGGGQCGLVEQSVAKSLVDGWRSRDFLYVVPSMILPLAGALAGLLLPRTRSALNAGAGIWLAWAVLSVLAGLLLTLDCHINHHQSYQALLAAHFGLLLVAAGSPLAFRGTLAVIIAYGLLVWIWDPLDQFASMDASAWLVLAGIFLLLPRLAAGKGTSPVREPPAAPAG